MVLDRSGSMGEMDGTGNKKIDALKCAMTGLGCAGDGFLGENFTPQDQCRHDQLWKARMWHRQWSRIYWQYLHAK